LIWNFAHSGLKEIFHHGHSSQVARPLATQCVLRLDVIDNARTIADMRMQGLTVTEQPPSSGVFEMPFMEVRIRFGWNGADATDVDLV